MRLESCHCFLYHVELSIKCHALMLLCCIRCCRLRVAGCKMGSGGSELAENAGKEINANCKGVVCGVTVTDIRSTVYNGNINLCPVMQFYWQLPHSPINPLIHLVAFCILQRDHQVRPISDGRRHHLSVRSLRHMRRFILRLSLWKSVTILLTNSSLCQNGNYYFFNRQCK